MLRALLASTLCFAFASPAPAQTLKIRTIDIGQGAATLIVSPSGQSMLVDGGQNGMGFGAIVPAMQGLGLTQLDYMVATHFDSDHIGGLDEVVQSGFLPTVAYDRGTFGGTPGHSSYSSYSSAISSRRQTITAGTTIDLGGGVIVTCITVNGQVHTGPTVNISSSAQFENSASVGLKLDYGAFDFWVGGDLTGGGNSTTDVESTAASVVGNLDVYTVNHHGSNTSTNANWVSRTQPEVSLVQAGSGNPFGHPTGPTLNRLNSTARATLVMSISEGAGNIGPVVAGRDIDLETDGTTYSLTWVGGPTYEILCDEIAGTPAVAGDLVISEVHVNPAQAPETEGEWFELAGTASMPVHLQGLSVRGQSEGLAFTIAVPLLVSQDEYLVIGRSGDSQTNGGYVPALVWPFNSYSLTNGNDLIAVRRGSSDVDSVTYDTSWPWGSGFSMERVDRSAPASLANFGSATGLYGAGDLGTPGEENDNNVMPAVFFAVGGSMAIGGDIQWTMNSPNDAGRFYIMANAAWFLPGFFFGNALVNLQPDALFNISLSFPGMTGVLPGSGQVTAQLFLPNDPLIQGLGFFSQAWTFEFNGIGIDVPSISPLLQNQIN